MRLLEHTKGEAGYKIRIWLDETKFDLSGQPYGEWVMEFSWGLDVPLKQVEDGTDDEGNPTYKEVPAMTQAEYEKSQFNEAVRQAKERLSAILGENQTQITSPKQL